MPHLVFIGSSSEHLDYAEAVHLNLSKTSDLIPICWNQGVQKQSQYTLDNLLAQLEASSYGVFVLSPDDLVESREKDYLAPRDNVIFELGMFFGSLGRERTFFLVPQLNSDLPFKIPSDLSGITHATYNCSNLVKGLTLQAATAAACIEIKNQIANICSDERLKDKIIKCGLFPEFNNDFKELFQNVNLLKTGFIHSRRWRENYQEEIQKFLSRKKSEWIIYLPNISNNKLIQHFREHFDDGKNMDDKIMDAYLFVEELMKKYTGKIKMYAYNLYQTYTFYCFDTKAVISMYPLGNQRNPTPTFLVEANSKFGEFFFNDVDLLVNDSEEMYIDKISRITKQYFKNK